MEEGGGEEATRDGRWLELEGKGEGGRMKGACAN